MSTTSMPVSADLKSVAVRSIHLMASGSRDEFDEVISAEGFTRERRAAPPPARGSGPDGFYQLALWLRAAFADLHYDIHHVIADGDLVTVNSTMNGRHTGPMIFYTEDVQVDAAFAPTGRPFAMTQSHWFRMKDGKIVEHWANRDDLGVARQLDWVPPTPRYLLRCARLKRQARKSLTS
ncbi:ester cyclase [Skermania sp. ID1734]|uniref:ester cyclase n=1 Tax=Skermania sp. ID1734 TaxID=2597516 RepID=UPI0011804E82|nr:ester cyclase [Skermania sp. ID1734]TSE01980.1 ester cyclase [Skermania sp. ID1734]